MKRCIGACSRGVVWKLLLVDEIERIAAEQEKLLAEGVLTRSDPQARTEEEEREVAAKIHPANFSAKDMNVLDKIIAMVFERTPMLDPEEVHFQVLAKKHFILKKLWYDEFGALPSV